MNIEISVSNELNRWMGLDAPRLVRKGSAVVGAQPISTSSHTVSWQAHFFTHHNDSASSFYTLVAVQAGSQYTLLIPYLHRPTQEQLAGDLVYRWGNELIHRMVDSGAIEKGDVEEVAEQFKGCNRRILWYLNSDPVLSDRATDSSQWLEGYLEAFELDHLEEDHTIDLGAHINGQSASTDGIEENKAAMISFVNDGLYRFARGLCREEFEGTEIGDFPYPWGDSPPQKRVPANSRVVRQLHGVVTDRDR